MAATALAPLIAAHPYRENLDRTRLVALPGAGRRTDALGTYHLARDRLVAGLGIERAVPLTGPRAVREGTRAARPRAAHPLARVCGRRPRTDYAAASSPRAGARDGHGPRAG